MNNRLLTQLSLYLAWSITCSFISMVSAIAQAPIKHYSIEDAVNTFNQSNTKETDVGYQYWFADKEFAEGKTVKLSVVAPHKATHAPHKHIEDEFFFVLEGTAEFYLNGETRTVGPMTSLYCPSWSMHGIKNVGDTELKYLVMKKYVAK